MCSSKSNKQTNINEEFIICLFYSSTSYQANTEQTIDWIGNEV